MQHVRREILVFEVGGRRYGLPASGVRELVRAVTISPLPLAPPIVEGVVNLRGEIVAVLDLRLRLGLAAKAIEVSDHLIIGQARGRLVAIRVDLALELATPEEVAGDPAGARESGRVAVSRVAKLPDGLVPILDLRAFLTEDESDALGEFLPNTGTVTEEGPP